MSISRRKFLPLLGAAALSPSLMSFSEETQTDTISKILPPALKKGATIAVTSPAGALRDLSTATKFKSKLQSLGFNVVMGETVNAKFGYLAGEDDLRVNELQRFFSDPAIDAIVCMKGGYGCMRIIDKLDYALIRKNPKIFMGFSDITALLNAVYLKSGVVTFHGPVGNSSWNDFSLLHINSVLMHGHQTIYRSPAKPEDEVKVVRAGKAEGILFGGNLSVLCGMIGTPYFPELKGAILFLEEVKEEPFRIDRMFAQLRLAGAFEKINGLIIGKFRDCIPEEPDFAFSSDEVIQQYFANAPFPVISNAMIGHIADKFTIPVGIRAQLDSESKSFRLLEPAVLT